MHKLSLLLFAYGFVSPKHLKKRKKDKSGLFFLPLLQLTVAHHTLLAIFTLSLTGGADVRCVYRKHN